ncbi:hypothetical protein SSX86_012412 [Deinandra increscens subsp. villosa]|uniref:Uncharacterized protein n=1 Tax=Deinandra increscens subsp. villosa TaxID=3103831 RepID=A0AAP0D5U7_9ASTR
MGWLTREGRSELSWVDQTLGSASVPPIQLLAFSGLVIFLMSMSTSTNDSENSKEREKLKLLLYLLPLALLLLTYVTVRNRLSNAVQAAGLPVESGKQDGSSPWRVAFVVVLVLVMVKYHY